MTNDEVLALAANHGLILNPASLSFNEAGLDYRVAFAMAHDGQRWVLRIPRRADVSKKMADEKRILDFVAPRLNVSVPQWQIHSTKLAAYPLLPGTPGLTLEESTGQPIWHFELENSQYCIELGRFIAKLHSLDISEARDAGIPVLEPSEVRSGWLQDLAKVRGSFLVPNILLERWTNWIRDDSLWPEFTVFTHGELYPAHTLLEDGTQIRSVLDWTTAKVTDPAVEFMFHYMLATPESFALTVRSYEEAGGRHRENLEAACAALIGAGALSYASFALESGLPEHRRSAQELLDSTAAELS